jgi:hypothetical protein
MHPAAAIITVWLCSFCDRELAAPTSVSPAPATDQEQHQDNNQNSCHVTPHLQEEAELAFVTVVPLLHYATFYEVAKADV